MYEEEPPPEPFAIDRDLQRELLMAMRVVYPQMLTQIEPEWPKVVGQLAYLEQHGLCDAGLIHHSGGIGWKGSKITARGLDFLEQDGGLSAILGAVTIKLHADTLRDLLAAKIDESQMFPEEKSILKEHLKKLPGTALQAASTDLVKIGLDHVPNAIHWLRTLLGLP